MMGTLVCKQCVGYFDTCTPSSSRENGCIYIRKTTEDEKHCDNKHRSSSIDADTPKTTASNGASGFWNSWESINTIKSKFEKDRKNELARVNSVGKMFGTKVSSFSSSTIERGRIPNNLIGNCELNRGYQEIQQLGNTDLQFYSNKLENGQRQLYQKNLNGNYGTNRTYPERQQSEIPPSSSSSCGDLPSSSNKSENGQVQLYQRNLNRNHGTNRTYPEIQQSEIPPSSSSCGDLPSSSNKLENSETRSYQENFVESFPSTSHQNRAKRSVNGDGVTKPLKDSVQCREKSVLCESKGETSVSKNRRNIEPILSVTSGIESSTNSGNNCEESETQVLGKVERSSKGAVPKEMPTFEMQEDLQQHNQRHNNSPGEKGNGLDLKNMTAEVSVKRSIHHSIGIDTGDNGCSCLDLTPPANLLATKEGRLKTYKNWPNKNIEPEKLAAAGFFYSGKTDIVECFECGIKGHNWLKNDDPMDDHKKWNRNCPFIRENAPEQNNVPQTGNDYCGNLDNVTSHYTASEEPRDYYHNLGVNISPSLQNGARTKQSESHNLEGLLLRTRKGPSHPDQIIYERRLATFANWPKSLKQKPADLAAAGFYYLGIGDQTLCFYCGGGLKDWVEEDDPWEQHALWFPQCNYLLLKKTPGFVKDVQEKHKSKSSSKQNDTEVVASCSNSNNSKESPSAEVEVRERNNAEESSTLCKICYKNELAVVFLPCGHMVACVDCASGLKECAICRKEIQANVRAFLS